MLNQLLASLLNPIETMLTTALDTSDVKKMESFQNLKHVNEAGDYFLSVGFRTFCSGF